jgi:hypothetical protein
MIAGLSLSKLDSVVVAHATIPYCQAIGGLLYLAQASWPDIAFAVGYLSKFVTGYDETHWAAVKHVLQYLHGTCSFIITYNWNTIDLHEPHTLIPQVWCDSDWGGNTINRRSVTGFILYLCGGLFAWTLRSQLSITLSLCEVEYNALSEVVKQVMYICKFFTPLGLDMTIPMKIYSDNQGAITLAHKTQPTFHPCTKHFDIKVQHLHETVATGIIDVEYCPTDQMIADMLTKALSRLKLHHLKTMGNLNNHESSCQLKGRIGE